ncbi:MAG: hypothetical protein FWE71_09880 [Nocardioidaceae bacterium]|nr:hypothetical protein [Nocardioidaceae bacterium]MCL2611936.1 hypothetical protein [Nocardioidaceae bacterium]
MSDPLPVPVGTGALGHDVPCSVCGHDHSALACDWCLCQHAIQVGIYL